MDEVDIERANIVAIIKEKYEKKLIKEPLPEPKVWVKEKIDTTDIKAEKIVKQEIKIKPKKNDTKPQTTLF
jgi:hypothetical protein